MYKLKAAIFDMDGVVTKTATLHFEAWKEVFDKIIHEKNNTMGAQEFTLQDYFYYLDGMPRTDGVRNFLESRQFSFVNFEKEEKDFIEYISHEKNQKFLYLLEQKKVECFESTIELIEQLKSINKKVAIISSSKNCQKILNKANIENLFSVRVDGEICEKFSIPGKPQPHIFLEAAHRLNLLPEQCMIVEDALAGVKAGKAGGFGFIIAIDRNNKLQEEFKNSKADIIVNDLSEIDFNIFKHN